MLGGSAALQPFNLRISTAEVTRLGVRLCSGIPDTSCPNNLSLPAVHRSRHWRFRPRPSANPWPAAKFNATSQKSARSAPVCPVVQGHDPCASRMIRHPPKDGTCARSLDSHCPSTRPPASPSSTSKPKRCNIRATSRPSPPREPYREAHRPWLVPTLSCLRGSGRRTCLAETDPYQ